MGKYAGKLDIKREIDINEMNENHLFIYPRAEKKDEMPTSTHHQNHQNPRGQEKIPKNPLSHEPTKPTKPSWRDKDEAYWKRIKNRGAYTGAVMICATLQPFEPLFTSARLKKLPLGGCMVRIAEAEWYRFSDIPGTLIEMETKWTALARICNRANRPLTPKEGAALNRAKVFLEWADAAHSPSEWRDLNALTENL